ncbi:MAG: CHASE2 domain-containing protein [Myxococcota bacterium]
MKKLFTVTPLKLSLGLSFLISGVLFLQDQLRWVNWLPYRLELKILDFNFLTRGPIPMEPQVVIAAGDEKAIDAFGLWGSWSRRVYAQMMTQLFNAGADIVAFDMVWSDEKGEGDSEQMSRVMLKYRQEGLDERGKEAAEKVAAARARLEELTKIVDSAEDLISAGKVTGKGKRQLQVTLTELREAQKDAAAELTAAHKSAGTLSEAVERYSQVLQEEAGGKSPDQELEEVVSEHSTRVVQGYIAEPNPGPEPPTPDKQHEHFKRVASAAVDTWYLDVKEVDASPRGKVARATHEMCEGKKACSVAAEELGNRLGMEEEQFIAGVKALVDAKAATMTETGLDVADPATLVPLFQKNADTRLVEWLPGAKEKRETELKPGVTVIKGDFIAPLDRFAEVGQNFGFYSAEPEVDGVFRKQPLFYRHWAPAPDEDASACTACNRAKLTPEKFEALEKPEVCSEVCRQECADCFIRAYYLPSLPLALVQQRFATTPVIIRDQNYQWLQSFSQVTLLPSDPVPVGRAPLVIPTDPSGKLQLNYYGPWRDPDTQKPLFPTLSVADIVEGKFDPKVVKGKAVLFAVTAIGTYDQRSTPFDPFVPGVAIHATAAQNMSDGRFLSRPQEIVMGEIAFVLIMGLLLGLLLHRLSVLVSFLVVAALFLVYGAASVGALSKGYWVHSFWAHLQLAFTWAAVVAHGYLTVGKEKAAMRKAFGATLDPVLVDELAKDPDAIKSLKGDEREATCMFSDIRGFTTLSENLTPEELTIFLNDYFTPQAAAIMHHKGYLDKYIGDAIMALFGAPHAFEDHAVSGCYAALDMMEQLHTFKKWVVSDPKWAAFCQRLTSKHMDPAAFDIGIGLNSGLMRVGFMGSSQRTNYSALGDAVNLASRLEGQTKEYGVHVIISENTYAAAKGKIHARLLDAIRVKGKKEPVRIYELIGKGDAPPEWAQFIQTFHTGIELFQGRRFADAIPYFAQALREKPLDPAYEAELQKKGKPRDLISAEYISRCMMYQENPPPPDWDGVVTKTTK